MIIPNVWKNKKCSKPPTNISSCEFEDQNMKQTTIDIVPTSQALLKKNGIGRKTHAKAHTPENPFRQKKLKYTCPMALWIQTLSEKVLNPPNKRKLYPKYCPLKIRLDP